MLCSTVCLSQLVLMLQLATGAMLNPAVIPGTVGICPSQEIRDATLQNITASVQAIIQENYSANVSSNSNCGDGLWYRVAYLNMSDPSQQCPSVWSENNTNGIRSCRRPQTSSGSCPGTSYTTGRQYSKVCGRVNGYQVGTTDAFFVYISPTIDSYYVYGVSVTHGVPRNHIWTFAAGLTEGGFHGQGLNCPCSDPSHPNNRFPPSFIGNNYYCKSGNPTNTYAVHQLYANDLLWDGQQCEGQCCSNGKSPPWFTVQLPNPTTDDIEVRICSVQGSIDETILQLVEIYYVQ